MLRKKEQNKTFYMRDLQFCVRALAKYSNNIYSLLFGLSKKTITYYSNYRQIFSNQKQIEIH